VVALTSIPNLHLLAEARSLSLADGTGVQTAVDTSGNNRSITQASATNRPTWIANQVGGHPCFRFTVASSQCFDTNAANNNWPVTLLALVKWAGGTTQRTVAGSDISGGFQLRLGGDGASNMQAIKAAEAVIGFASSGPAADAWSVVSVRYDGTATGPKFWINGTVSPTTNPAATTAREFATWRIGASAIFEGFQGDMAALAIYNRVLSDAEIPGAHSYFQDIYGVAVADYVTPWLPPTNLLVTHPSPTQSDLTWTAVLGARFYQVERNGELLSVRVTGTSYSDTGLSASTPYSYRVRAEK